MSAIWLKNTTGKQAGRFVRFETGEDLFGYLFYDMVSGKRHVGKKLRTRIFNSPRDFICALDLELYNQENRNYLPEDD